MKIKFKKNEKGYAALAITLIIAVVALTMVSSLQNQVHLFTKGLVRARALSEAQFVIESFGLKLREAYIQARPVPEAVNASVTYKKDTDATHFRLVKSTGSLTEITIYSLGNQLCIERPLNKSYLIDPICITIPDDFLAKREDILSWKDYATFFVYQFNELVSLPEAVAGPYVKDDPGTSAMAAAVFGVSRDFTNENFYEDYIEQRCGGGSPNSNVDCFRFRFCLARFKADCTAAAGNDRFVIQTVVLRKPPETSMGF